MYTQPSFSAAMHYFAERTQVAAVLVPVSMTNWTPQLFQWREMMHTMITQPDAPRINFNELSVMCYTEHKGVPIP
jgi:hypothetical protein